MSKLIFILWALVFVSCTLSIIQTDTEGTATDIVDTNQDAKGDLNFKIPEIPL